MNGWEREWAYVQKQAGAPRPTSLGCSRISHDLLGFCWHCVPGEDGPVYELMAWRLLALKEKDGVLLTRAEFSALMWDFGTDCPVHTDVHAALSEQHPGWEQWEDK